MHITYEGSELVAPNIQTFFFRAETKPDYVAGQFIEITLPHKHVDQRGQKRWFTLSSSPSEELLAITTKCAGPSSTFKQTLFGLMPGVSVMISEPMGDFVLPKDNQLPLLFVAGGLGITPVRSMVKWLCDNNDRRDVTIIYRVSNKDDIAFIDLFESYGVKPKTILSQQTSDWPGIKGPLTADTILSLLPNIQEALIYVSGPELMVERLEEELKFKKIRPDKLVLDFFPGYPAI
ncbi:MAG TPA: FAD-dependent oxidoreductase [Candidatus Limnocylindrales bacterium]|nr:FAD-dependent oxidoreductase [Candidatus Limnocylindrales bacterium]